MVLLASDYDKSNYLRAEDIKQDRKFRIKAVTEQMFERDGSKEKKLVCLVHQRRARPGAEQDQHQNPARRIRRRHGQLESAKSSPCFRSMADFRGKMTPGLRVRIPPPKQAAEAVPAPSPAPTGNGAAAAAAADPELKPDPVKPLREELDDEIPF